MTTSTDRIEKHITVRAPRDRVWRAISDAKRFGAWFGVDFDGPFEPSSRLVGKVRPTTVDPVVAKTQEAYAGAKFEIVVDRIEAPRLFSFRWHPFAVDPKVDYSGEQMTLVVFELSDAPDGTTVTITETGFDAIPLERRARAFAANDGGWTAQTSLLAKYLAAEPQ